MTPSRRHITTLPARLRARLSKRTRSYLIHVTSGACRSAGPKGRKLMSDWLARDFELIRATSLGTCYVIDPFLARGALTAILWLSEMSTPYKVESTLEAALGHASSAMEGAGLLVPTPLVSGGANALREQVRRQLPHRGV